jgi:hypothetical protein
MNGVFREYLNKFVNVFLDDILVLLEFRVKCRMLVSFNFSNKQDKLDL